MTTHESPANSSARSEQSLAEVFHLVKSLIPPNQPLVIAGRDTTVQEAIRLMDEHCYSQLPVVSGDAVLGVFSYRSLANHLPKLGSQKVDIASLPVEELMETYQYVQPSDSWESILGHLDRDDGVLVGHRDDLRGIVTPLDVLKYLHKIARPFVIIAEIEITLRRLIRACVDDQTLRQCICDSLSSKYPQDRLPTTLEDMEFNDYAQIMCHRQNWTYFAPVFGSSDFQRKDAQCRLNLVRDLRNTVFHFREELTRDQQDRLDEQRAWLQIKARAFEGQKRAESQAQALRPAEAVPNVPQPTARQRVWDEGSFLRALAERAPEAVPVAQRILAWSRTHATRIEWGRGKFYGTFVPVLQKQGKAYHLFAVWTNGILQFYFAYLREKPPFDEPTKLAELIRRISAIPGLSLPDDAAAHYISCPLTLLCDETRLDELFDVFTWVINELGTPG